MDTYNLHNPLLWQGKGSMPTYWLVEKEGGVSRALEIEVPGFFDANEVPDFMNPGLMG